MACRNPRCMGNYDFEHIAFYARKRFIDGCKTVDLMLAAGSKREREEIALASSLDLEDGQVRDMKLCCKYAAECKAVTCRQRLIKIIEKERS